MVPNAPHGINVDSLALGKLLTKLYVTPPVPLTPAEYKKRAALLKERTGVDQLLVVVRNFIGSSHNYTYFNEGF